MRKTFRYLGRLGAALVLSAGLSLGAVAVGPAGVAQADIGCC
ncbi:hypothetical protein GCM10010399_30930 [Dactylosporangium fulvum]|uniref:Uncharacterized protein n=1 Tax=Dactylosporangium fulvum TaxID=53359 RepID=A0ABY5W7L7_9ACTN|nr:hypothetical protein [Dactylosporangium fulvum]UWP85355.1 hypothetical protein Dfulv_14420 [Dactylosporangium fulvum]